MENFPLIWDGFPKESQVRIRELFLGGVVSVVCPAILPVALIPAPDGIVVQVKKFCDLSTAFPVVEQHDRICPPAIPWSSHWRRTQASSSIRSAEERKPGRIMGFDESFHTQPSSHQIHLPRDSEYKLD